MKNLRKFVRVRVNLQIVLVCNNSISTFDISIYACHVYCFNQSKTSSMWRCISYKNAIKPILVLFYLIKTSSTFLLVFLFFVLATILRHTSYFAHFSFPLDSSKLLQFGTAFVQECTVYVQLIFI